LNNLPVPAVDIIFILIILFFTARCIIKGFVAEIMAVLSVIGGVIAGYIFSAALSSVIDQYIGISGWNRLISFLIIFLTVYLVIKFLERIFYSLIEKVNLERLDRSLGLFLGLFEGIILILLIVTILDAQPFFPADRLLSDSIVALYVRKILILMPAQKIIVPVI